MVKREKLLGFCLFAIVISVYLIFAGRGEFKFPTHWANYLSHLSLSIMNGRFDLVGTFVHDLSQYNGKFYPYWGVGNVLVIWPFVKFFGVGVSDALYSAIIGGFSSFILYFLFWNMEKSGYSKGIGLARRIILTLFFSFGTVYFMVGTNGGVWFTALTISIFYLFICLFFVFRYMRKKDLLSLFLASFFFGLTIAARIVLGGYGLFLLAVILGRKLKKGMLLKHLLVFFSVTGVFLAIIGFYNYLRFGSFFETGLSYHLYDQRFASDIKAYGMFNLHYVPHNLYVMFFHLPKFVFEFPFFIPDAEGNSFIFFSPLFLVLWYVFKRNFWSKYKLESASLALVILFALSYLLTVFATGWMQFGARYSLDFTPALIILMARACHKVNMKVMVLLLLMSIFFNTVGAWKHM